MNNIETAKQIIKQELNFNIKELSQLGGGSINSVFLVEMDKSKIVLKIND